MLCLDLQAQKKNNTQLDSLTTVIENLQEQLIFQNNKVESLTRDVQKLHEDQIRTSESLRTQKSLIETTFNGVSTQLSASSIFVGIFGIVIAVFSIGLSIYVSRISRNIQNISKDNEILLQKNIDIKSDVESLSEKITKDSTDLYTIIRNEESNHILQRLIEVPEDMGNVFPLLASRDLELSHYSQLKEAYNQLDDEFIKSSYLILFFQHFAGTTIIDSDLSEDLLKNLGECIQSSFKNDIVNASNHFFRKIVDQGIQDYKIAINKFVKEFSKSKFSELEDVYMTIYSSMTSKNQLFEFYNLVDRNDETLKFRSKFGQLLIDSQFQDLEKKEASIITEIENLNKKENE